MSEPQDLRSVYARVRLVVEFRVTEFSDSRSVREMFAAGRQQALTQARGMQSVLREQWDELRLIGEPVVELVLVPESGKPFAPPVEAAEQEGSNGQK